MKKQFLFLIPLFIFSCGNKNTENQQEKPLRSEQIKYAQGFEIDYFEHYKRITIKSPWKKSEKQQILYLVDNKEIKLDRKSVV